jgi:hypothetical protein
MEQDIGISSIPDVIITYTAFSQSSRIRLHTKCNRYTSFNLATRT